MMKFKSNSRRRALEYEKEWAKTWKDNKTFEKSVENRPADNGYVFYDGPPFITGVPHHGTLLSSIVKDAVPRYWTMKGKRVERVWGWDTHGLPAENFVEKQLNIVDRRQIVVGKSMSDNISQSEDVDSKLCLTTFIEAPVELVWDFTLNPENTPKYFDSINEEEFSEFPAKLGTRFKNRSKSDDEWSEVEVIDFKLHDTFTLEGAKGDFRVKYSFVEKDRGTDFTYEEWNTDGSELESPSPVSVVEKLKREVENIAGVDSEVPLDKEGNELPTVSLETYINKARESMVANAATWEDVVDRVGRWVDFSGAYKTMDKDYMESVWWAFKELYEKGKIYEGEKVLMYDTKFATPVSKNEVTMDNDAYQTVTDPSVYVKFRLNNLSDIDRVVNFEIDKDHNYIMYDLTDDIHNFDFPKEINGLQLKKGEFHLSLLKVIDDYDLDAEGRVKLEEISKQAGASMRSKPKLTGEFLRLVDDGSERETIIALIEWGELEEWREKVREIIPNADFVIPHTTLYVGENGSIGYSTATKSLARKLDEKTKKILCEATEKKRAMAHLLAWTTTPWTLPGNTALAVSSELDYVEVELDGERLIVAKDLAPKVFVDDKKQPLDYSVVRELKGAELVGQSYQPLFEDHGGNAHKIWAADYVSADSGTGIVHIAPAYGEDDFELAKAEDIPVVHTLDDNGFYFPEVAEQLLALMPWVDNTKPLEVWDNNKNIAKGLQKAGIVWKTEYIQHEYPFNPRSKQRIMYRAIPSWFFDVQGSKPKMLEQNENINWFPEHLKHGRFAKNIEQAPDWNLSRDRFWATAMPVWKGDRGTVKVIGSYAELKELSGVELEDYHRPWVDDITFEIDGEHFTRIEKVLDCWFESGSMPFAQFHYPFENKEKFEANYPGDFIVEYIGQVRAWFYYVHTINTALFGEQAFNNVITTGTLAGNDGRKMSKSLGNYTDPNELMDKFSADSLRFLLLSSPLLKGEDFSLQDKDVGDVARKLSMVWNMYDFFTMYAEVDGWEFDASKPFTTNPDDVSNPLDKWIVSRVHQLNQHITEHMDDYNLPEAMSDILPLLDDASNWYVRRSRRRFWKSEDDGDKAEAYRTLHYVLLKLSVVLAPFTPFLAEELYQKLGGGAASVHLLDWPTNYTVDQKVLDEMQQARSVINDILSIRAKQGIKTRQPLGYAKVETVHDFRPEIREMVIDEVNIKQIEFVCNPALHGQRENTKIGVELNITPELKREGYMREVIRHVQAARKSAELNVDDRIKLQLDTDDTELSKALEEYHDTIYAETLATKSDSVVAEPVAAKIDGIELSIYLAKT